VLDGTLTEEYEDGTKQTYEQGSGFWQSMHKAHRRKKPGNEAGDDPCRVCERRRKGEDSGCASGASEVDRCAGIREWEILQKKIPEARGAGVHSRPPKGILSRAF
jgi:hypothetical protein